MESLSSAVAELSHGSSATICSGKSNVNGVQPQKQPPPPPSPLQPKTTIRSESSCAYPTTFVQAYAFSFKQVVQMLTGSSETAKQANSKISSSAAEQSSKAHFPPVKSNPMKQPSGFKLFERRNSLKKLKINPLIPPFAASGSGVYPRNPEILSSGILDFPALVLSPVTPLIPDPFDRSAFPNHRRHAGGNAVGPPLNTEAEEKAIKEKGFFLHPSPASTPRDSEPRLLPLFPTTSPRATGSSS